MSQELTAYNKKRSRTSLEPIGLKRRAKGQAPLIFVIQEHHASHLHYDLRIELDGVLKSWSVPKGPSLEPKVKRLAVQVEDHPFDYAYFEGTIPQGHYGAGQVALWDGGTYHPLEGKSRQEQEDIVRAQYAKGRLSLIFAGKKLVGEYSLVRMQTTASKPQWLLIKAQGSKSILANETLDTPKALKPTHEVDAVASALKAPIQPAPKQIKPMLCYTVDEPFDKKGWLFEIKWDGYRAIASMEKGAIALYSRNFLSFESKFPGVVKALKHIKEDVVFDGEIVLIDQEGKSKFQQLQNYLESHKYQGKICYCIFDLLFYQGRDMRPLPLFTRKALLKIILEKYPHETLVYSDHVEQRGISFCKEIAKRGLEGVIAKNGASVYTSLRSKDWLKVKTHLRQEVVIAGYTPPEGIRKYFGALILGVYEGEQLVYVGNVGTGFNEQSLGEIYRLLSSHRIEKCPFEKAPKLKRKATWVEPALACEVSFTEWTKAGYIRHPSFKGLRLEKPIKSIGKEMVLKTKHVLKEMQELYTHPEKIFWPKEGYTKGDLLNYYQAIAPYLLPHLKGRPVMLHRFPNGIAGQDFFQKNMTHTTPPWFQTATIEHAEGTVAYPLIEDVQSLIYVANLGTVDIHPFLSRLETLHQPDFLVLDLDPLDVKFEKVIEVAQCAHELLQRIKVESFCKTSGKRGLHIYVPLNAKYTFEVAENFGKLLAHLIYEQQPTLCSLERLPKNRHNRVYIDYLQNGMTKSVVAPYAVRALDEAPVATPLQWDEVKWGLEPKEFTIKTILKRAQKKGDLFAKVLGKGVDIDGAIKRIAKLGLA